MQSWVFQAEEILSGEYFSLKQPPGNSMSEEKSKVELSNEQVGQRFDEWCEELHHFKLTRV